MQFAVKPFAFSFRKWSSVVSKVRSCGIAVAAINRSASGKSEGFSWLSLWTGIVCSLLFAEWIVHRKVYPFAYSKCIHATCKVTVLELGGDSDIAVF